MVDALRSAGEHELRQLPAAMREAPERSTGRTMLELEIAALWPSPESWADGDRLVVCAVFRLDGAPMTGSARNSRQ